MYSALPKLRESGFTLLETIVALVVLGFLMVALFQGMRTGLEFWNSQARHIGTASELDAGTRVIRGILTTIPVEPAALGASISIGFKGQSDWMTLVGRLPTGFGARRLVDMTLYLKGDKLLISWTPHRHDLTQELSTPTVAELMRGIRNLEFAYWGSALPNLSAGWQSRWEGPNLPGLIRLRMRFAAGDDRRWPDLVVAPRL